MQSEENHRDRSSFVHAIPPLLPVQGVQLCRQSSPSPITSTLISVAVQEVALSALYVSSKLHDTLKKPRDIILSSYALRFPHLVKKGALDPSAVDPNVLEGERKRVLSIERLVLETMCFKFEVDTGLGSVVKIGRAMGCELPLA